ncbi:MAG TPA: ATP-binding protein, partial [Acidimicrobiales bacterium]|nr:ATP-binding protein [Acidimicrobiales bacterium]
MLGRESRRLMLSPSRLHAHARQLLADLGIPLFDTTQLVDTLSGGQRQLLAVARAMRDRPGLLVLDEPTAALGVAETKQVEELTVGLRRCGVSVLLVSHDVEQMFRLADRIVVLRHGRVVDDLRPADSHPDEVTALITGQEVDVSARRQLDRLHGLVDRLASAEPGSAVALVLSSLATALRGGRLALHVVHEDGLEQVAALGLPMTLRDAWRRLPIGAAGGPAGMAAATGQPTVDIDAPPASGQVGSASSWRAAAGVGAAASAWAVPIQGSAGVLGAITVLQAAGGRPHRDEIDLVALYAGHAAGAIEREGLLDQVTARNRVLESIRDVLQSLAGPAGEHGLQAALSALRAGLQATEVGVLDVPAAGGCRERAVVDAAGAQPSASPLLLAAAPPAAPVRADGRARTIAARLGPLLAVAFPSPAGSSVLAARWAGRAAPADATALLEDAGNSLRLALEREEAERAHQEALSLRRSQELQRQFLSRLSHELRTPLTAIHGYASSLQQTDVTWDAETEARFLERIAAESSRLARLVGDLLDFSAIESSVLRLQPDWCELPLVVDAAVACVARPVGTTITARCGAVLPVVWADHDRLEQVLVNLLDNAVHHNPPGTNVLVDARLSGAEVLVVVADDGIGAPADLLSSPPGAPRERRASTSGAGLGLSIARGIVAAHGWRLEMRAVTRGTCFVMRLPVERPAPPPDAEVGERPAAAAAGGG